MISGTIALLLGCLAALHLHPIPVLWGVGMLVLLTVGLVGAPRLRLPGLWLAGAVWTLLRASMILSHGLPPALEGRDLTVTGVVASIPAPVGEGLRFVFEVERMRLGPREAVPPGRIRLSWYGQAPDLVVGERWRLTVRLKRPRGLSNPGGFDYEAWLFQRGIRATGYVRPSGANARLSPATGHRLGRLRQDLGLRIAQALHGHPQTGVIQALSVGLRHNLGPTRWQVLRATGTSHLMAISGLHVGLAAGAGYLLSRQLWSLSPRLVLWLAAPRFAALMATLSALGYSALAGFSVPTQRALIMIGVVMAGQLLRSRAPSGRSLALGLACVLALDPLATLSAGFWLSFCAVAVILLGMGGRPGRQGLWWRWGRVHWLVAVGLLPVLLVLFRASPWLGPVANLVAVPWTGLVVVPLVLIGTMTLRPMPSLGTGLLWAAATAVDWLWGMLERLAEMDLVYRPALPDSGWLVAVSGVGAVLLCLPRGVPGRWLGLAWLAPVFFVTAPRPAPGELWLTTLDVGQGLSVVARTREHVLVYDTGPRYSAGFDAGRAALIPFLREQGLTSVDALVLSHGDEDHTGGTRSLLAGIPVTRIMAGPDAGLPGAIPCRRGVTWEWDGVRFSVLHPGPDSPAQGNDASCVLRIQTRRGTALLPGDLGTQGERELLRDDPGALKAGLLVVPHHGSLTSSSKAFLDAVQPTDAVFSLGYRNRFHFPHPRVLARYLSRGIRVHDTASDGAVTFRLGAAGNPAGPRYYRRSSAPFWRTPIRAVGCQAIDCNP